MNRKYKVIKCSEDKLEDSLTEWYKQGYAVMEIYQREKEDGTAYYLIVFQFRSVQ